MGGDKALDSMEQGHQQSGNILNEQNIQNAITFLMHPQVRNSTQSVQRQFLQQKGLNALEIEEAFKRIQLSQSANYKQQPAIGSAIGYKGVQVLIGVGVIAGLTYLLKQWISPLVSGWLEQYTGLSLTAKPVDTQLASEMRRATEAIQGVAADLKSSLAGISSTMHVQQEQLRTQMMAMREEIRVSLSNSPSPFPYNPIAGVITRSSTPDQPPHPERYGQLVAMLNRGETPENVKAIDDSPPDPTLRVAPSQRARPTKPWEGRNKSQDSAFFAGLERSIGSARTLRSESGVNQGNEDDDVNNASITNSYLHGMDHN